MNVQQSPADYDSTLRYLDRECANVYHILQMNEQQYQPPNCLVNGSGLNQPLPPADMLAAPVPVQPYDGASTVELPAVLMGVPEQSNANSQIPEAVVQQSIGQNAGIKTIKKKKVITDKKFRGKALDSQAQEIIRNVVGICRQEAVKGSLIYPIRNIQRRAAHLTGVHVNTIRKIVKSMNAGQPVKMPKKLKPTRKKPVTAVGDFDKNVIRGIIYEMNGRNEAPTLKKLRSMLHDAIGFQGSTSSVRGIIRSMGFRWKRQNNKRILHEVHAGNSNKMNNS